MSTLAERYFRLRGRIAPVARRFGIAKTAHPLARWTDTTLWRRPVRANLDAGFQMYLNPADKAIARTILSTGSWQPIEAKHLDDLLDPGDIFIDVGANVGYFSLLAARRVGPNGRVIAVEPDPANFALLQRNVYLNGLHNVELIMCALGHESGEMLLTRDKENFGNHSLVPANVVVPGEQIVVPVTTLDTLLEELAVPAVDIVKIDVQGWESHVLTGAVGCLRSVSHLLMEFWPEGLTQAGSDPRDLLAMMSRLGHLQIFAVDTWSRDTSESIDSILEVCRASESGQIDLVLTPYSC